MKPLDETKQDENVPTESVIDLPVPDEQADQAHAGSELSSFAGQTIRLRIAVANNQ